MADKPFISVVIPLYNKEKSIIKTLNSIFQQSFPDFEIVIVDDGSTDRSCQIVREIQNTHEKGGIIKLVQQKNAGPSAARNTGVRHVTAEWVVFLDADDEITSDALEYYSKMITAHPDMDILDCAKYIRYGDNLVPFPHPIEGWVKNNMRECFFGNILPGAGFSVFRKTLLDRCPYDERIRRYEDAEWLLRLLDGTKVYSSRHVTSIHDTNFAEASAPRKDFREDYIAYLDFNKGGFWRKMCVYRSFLEGRELYQEACHSLYRKWYWRYDLLLLYKILNLFRFKKF